MPPNTNLNKTSPKMILKKQLNYNTKMHTLNPTYLQTDGQTPLPKSPCPSPYIAIVIVIIEKQITNDQQWKQKNVK